MKANDREWLERYLEARRKRLREGTELTHRMLNRSREQIALSAELLKFEVPVVWHPEPPKQEAITTQPHNRVKRSRRPHEQCAPCS